MIDVQRNKEKFLLYCRTHIKREGLESLLSFLESSDFFEAPSSCNYHGNYKGGLCEHSLNVFEVCKDLYEKIIKTYESQERTNYGQSTITLESIAIACLFHDLTKVNIYHEVQKWKKDEDTGQWISYLSYKIQDNFPLPHATKSLVIVLQHMKLTGHEMLAIQWHMGSTDVSNIIDNSNKYAYQEALKVSPLVTLVAQADMMSSFLLEKQI